MKKLDVLVVRIYLTESSNLLKKIVDYLKKQAKIRGLTVFRAIKGFGDTGDPTAALLHLSLDLPLVIEFFDQKEKVEKALENLNHPIKSGHIISWEAKLYV